jgi:hypothetical protein
LSFRQSGGSIGSATYCAVASYDKDREAEHMAESARQAVVNTGLAGVGVGLGVAATTGNKPPGGSPAF